MEQNPNDKSMVEHQNRWNSLPDDIITKIISYLDPLKGFVIDISTFAFNIKQVKQPYPNNIYNKYVCWTVLDNIFTLFTPPIINSFGLHLHVDNYANAGCWSIIASWASRLCSRNIQHVVISKFGSGGGSDVGVCPPSVFRMRSLVSLDLDLSTRGMRWSNPPSINLPNLKKLHLRSFNSRYVQELLSFCPSLEDLSMCVNEPEKKSALSITSKSLKGLSIHLYEVKELTIEAPMLRRLTYKSRSKLSMQMLDSISYYIEWLELNTYWTTRLYKSDKKTIFPNLTYLSLTLRPKLFQEIFYNQRLHCPNLKHFVLHILNNDEMIKAEFDKYMIWNQEAKFLVVEQVKSLEVGTTYVNRYSQRMLSIVTWLLRSAKVLETLVLNAYDQYNLSNRAQYQKWQGFAKHQFCQTLFECVEDTSRCQIALVGSYELD